MPTDPAAELIGAVAALGIPALPTPLKLTGDWMIAGDIHAPFTNLDLAIKLAKVARKELKRPRRLLLAGDIFDGGLFSKYADIIPRPSWATERDTAKALVKAWGSTFDEIVAIMGNHDRREQKATMGERDDIDIFSPLAAVHPNLKSSNYGWAEIDTPAGLWRVTHPAAYRQQPLSVVNELAQKYQCHVIGWHEHHFGITWDKWGRYLIVNGGMLADDSKFAYVHMDDTIRPRMKPGFVMLRAGIPTLFGRYPYTDWRKYT